jgi:hypothetical protein
MIRKLLALFKPKPVSEIDSTGRPLIGSEGFSPNHSNK